MMVPMAPQPMAPAEIRKTVTKPRRMLAHVLLVIGGALASSLTLTIGLLLRDPGGFNHSWEVPLVGSLDDVHMAMLTAFVGVLGIWLIRCGLRQLPFWTVMRSRRPESLPSVDSSDRSET